MSAPCAAMKALPHTSRSIARRAHAALAHLIDDMDRGLGRAPRSTAARNLATRTRSKMQTTPRRCCSGPAPCSAPALARGASTSSWRGVHHPLPLLGSCAQQQQQQPWEQQRACSTSAAIGAPCAAARHPACGLQPAPPQRDGVPSSWSSSRSCCRAPAGARGPPRSAVTAGAQASGAQWPAATPGASSPQAPLPQQLPGGEQPHGITRSQQRANFGELQSLIAAIPFRRLSIWAAMAFLAYQLSDFFGVSARAAEDLHARPNNCACVRVRVRLIRSRSKGHRPACTPACVRALHACRS